MKNVLFYSHDFNLCYSLLMYLQESYSVTATTNLKAIGAFAGSADFDLVILDDAPSKEILELCRDLKETKPGVPVIITYVFDKKTKDIEPSLRQYVTSIFYKPYDLNEVTMKMASLMV
jgi:DNA-binding response OmpR family regulator